jgi:protein tyrosine/serine phosphatase
MVRTVRAFLSGAVLIVGILSVQPAPLLARETTNAVALQRIKIDNFGQVSDSYFRGGQPNGHDFDDLKALGVKTVIDLTKDGDASEPGIVQGLGLKFYRIPMTTTDIPSAKAVDDFLAIVNDPSNLPVYVHCQGGRHRTGTMTAIYRLTHDHWTADQAYGEMKKFGFETFIGHPQLKTFVYDYYQKLTTAPNGKVARTA